MDDVPANPDPATCIVLHLQARGSKGSLFLPSERINRPRLPRASVVSILVDDIASVVYHLGSLVTTFGEMGLLMGMGMGMGSQTD